MNHHLPPEAWRSEAFAEDLFDGDAGTPAEPAGRSTLRSALLGMLPLALAAAGAMAAVWSGA